MLSCTPDALWEAFAGADSPPTVQEGGYWFVMALTQTLKNQQLTLWGSQVRELFSDLPRLSKPLIELELPGQREHFAPFIEDFLLHKCTGAREELEVIAGLGNISFDRLLRWATQHQKEWPVPAPAPRSAEKRLELASEAPQQITSEQVKDLLQEEFEQLSLQAAIRAIALRLQTNAGRIQGIVYGKGLNEYWKKSHAPPKKKGEDVALTVSEPEMPPLTVVTAPKPGQTASDIFFSQQPDIAELSKLLLTADCRQERKVQLGQVTQYFYEGPYGVSLAFLPQPDETRTIQEPRHEARAWLWGAAHEKSLDIQRQILEAVIGAYPQTLMRLDALFNTPASQQVV